MIQEEFLQEQLEEVKMRLQDHVASAEAPVVQCARAAGARGPFQALRL